ncbi:hypothetical protein WICPIJ_004830 [Wickerhamomyces pijperi]|uniref:Serine aminopeptidase S33 domain-containing protein n=1 Tax=Wickerhamomyces pijperi TaxID=599730 RepID=A0A9P8Q559_WICPI|nr:hypothetical protein WICPIJ_004830 [Wickerhamomyces pijperi]
MIHIIPNAYNISLEQNEALISITIPNETNGSIFPNSHSHSQGIVGILSKPTIKPRVHKTEKSSLALILHGRGGHKNYIYHRQLAEALAAEGFYSFRFDFRDCGDSQNGLSETGKGRSIEQDLEDIDVVSKALENETDKTLRGLIDDSHKALRLELIVGHSRGSMAMFQFMIQNQNNQSYQNLKLVNCASRFNARKILSLFQPSSKNLTLTHYRFGKYVTSTLPFSEIIGLSQQNLARVSELPPTVQVLSVYGELDDVVPSEDALCFQEHLGFERHKLIIIPEADHNFIGVKMVQEGQDISNLGKYGLKNGKINYNPVVVEEIIKWLNGSNA